MSEKQTPHLSVVSGNPTSEELAVVIAVVQAALSQRAAVSSAESQRLAKWHRNAGVLRAPIVPGNGQWSASVRRGLH